MPHLKCPKNTKPTKTTICKDSRRKECPPGSVPTLTCRRLVSKKREPSYKDKEVEQLKQEIQRLENEMDDFMKETNNIYQSKLIKNISESQSRADIINFVENTIIQHNKLLYSVIKTPIEFADFIQKTFSKMIDKKNIVAISSPTRRYDVMAGDSIMATLPTTRLSVFRICLRYYTKDTKEFKQPVNYSEIFSFDSI